MTNPRSYLLGLVLLGALSGCQEQDQVDTAMTFDQVSGQSYDTKVDLREADILEDPHWECRDVYRVWSFTENEVIQVVACDLCYTGPSTTACSEEIREYPLFFVLDSEVEIEESQGLLQVFYGDGCVAEFEKVETARVYPDDLFIRQADDEDTVDTYLDAEIIELDAVPEDMFQWSREHFADYDQDDLP